jgi:hypothetical protein
VNRNSVKRLTPTQAAYIAGLVDGDGSIAVARKKTGPKGCKSAGFDYRSSLMIAMTDLKTLKWLQEVTGVGTIHRRKNYNKEKWAQAWKWDVWAYQAADIIRQILPYLVLKAPNGRNLILFQSSIRVAGRHGLTKEEIRFREKCCETSMKLNRRGPRD